VLPGRLQPKLESVLLVGLNSREDDRLEAPWRHLGSACEGQQQRSNERKQGCYPAFL
jgi:hypothetical protein